MTLLRGLILLALLIQVAGAIAFYFAVKRVLRRRIPPLVMIWIVVSLAPLLVPGPRRLPRAYVTLFAITVMVKLYDLAHEATNGRQPSLLRFLAGLSNGFWLVTSHRPIESKLTRRANFLLLLGRAPMFGLSLIASFLVFHIDWSAYSFLLEHTCKALVVYGLVIFGGNTLAAGWRLIGLTGMDPFHHPAVARTPAAVWRRWNRPAAAVIHEYVFRRAGGHRFPARATLAAFFFSAVVHEYLFAIVLGRALGFQFAFFMINGCAAVATLGIRPTGWRAILWIALTFTFALMTSVLFFASVNHVLPFYSRPLPGWIGAWDRWVGR